MSYIQHDNKFWYFRIDKAPWNKWGFYTQFHTSDYASGFRRVNLIYPVDKMGNFVQPQLLRPVEGMMPLKDYIDQFGYERFKSSHQAVVADLDDFVLVAKIGADIYPDNSIKRSKVELFFTVDKRDSTGLFLDERGKKYSELVTISLRDKLQYKALREAFSDDYIELLKQKVMANIDYNMIASRKDFITGLISDDKNADTGREEIR